VLELESTARLASMPAMLVRGEKDGAALGGGGAEDSSEEVAASVALAGELAAGAFRSASHLFAS
jgi:hypothetical protein